MHETVGSVNKSLRNGRNSID